MASIFDEWDYSDAKAAAQLSTEDSKRLDSYRRAVGGDQFQNWDWWIGPMPLETDQDAAIVRTAIERGFVSRNALSGCVGRHTNGVLARSVKWSIIPVRELANDQQPTPEEQTRIDEAEALLKQWVKERKLNQEYDKLCDDLLIAGVAYQRPFIAPGEIDENGIVPQADLATSLNRVYFNFPLPGEAVVWTDPRTQQKCSVYLYREVTSSRPSEAAKQQGDERAELTYLDGDQTIIRIVGGDTDSVSEFSYPLGKRILMSNMNRRPLINPQVVSQQKLLNLALTMKERNVILGGFLERVAINAQMNGSFETLGDGSKRFVADPLPVGAGAMTTLTGYVISDEDGKQRLSTPNMLWREPVDVTTFLETEQSAYEAILAECNQLHYSMSNDATASGVSRLTAMAAYLIDLIQTKQQIDAGWAWLLETALSLAAVLSGQAGRYGDLRVAAECSVDPGPISVEMLKATMELTGGQPLLSVDTAMGWIGVEDSTAEQAKMEEEQAAQSEREAEMASIALERAQREFNAGQVQDDALEDEPRPEGSRFSARRNGVGERI